MKDWGQNLIHRYWVDGLDKRLPVFATLLAIVLLTHSMASLTWKVVPVPQVEDSPAGASQTASIASGGNVPSTDQPVARTIQQWHLFGEFVKEAPKPKPQLDVAKAPETRLNLKLRGVFSSDDKELARAIIADAKGHDDSYAIGDQVPGGAVLNDIFPDKVILERNGQLETLKLPEESQEGVVTAQSLRSRPPIPSRAPVRGSAPINTTTSSTQEILRHYQNALVNDPQSLMGLVRVQPYSKNGKLEGYRIRPGKDRRLLSKFGLRSGDVVKSVNGVPLDNPIKALEIMKQLSTASSVTLEVERNGTPRSFTFSLQ
jgi:general secretion pathway protein C